MKPTLLRYLEVALLARRPSPAQRLAVAATRLLRPGVLDTRETLRRHFERHVRVSLRAWGDDDPDEYRRLQTGDTWLRHGLLTALGEAGFVVTDVDPDVVIHLHGKDVDLPRRAVKVLWVHSHPETVTDATLARHDHVFCASRALAERWRARGHAASVLPLATGLRPRGARLRHEVVFVGNARVDGTRPILEHLGAPDFELAIWGGGYRERPAGTWRGPCLPYQELPDVYGGAVISLNDHLPSMAEAGIVTPRVYDILASGGFCISDANPGLTEIFGDTVPQYRTPDELRALVRHFLDHPDERRPLMAAGQAIALAATWPDRARALMAPTGFASGGATAAVQRPR